LWNEIILKKDETAMGEDNRADGHGRENPRPTTIAWPSTTNQAGTVKSKHVGGTITKKKKSTS
jgi:hypothetical protein